MHINNLNITMVCLILSGICDLFDGKIARMCKRNDLEKKFGIEIDSLADVISFLILPCIILNHVCSNMIVILFYILTGITRLGYFNVTTEGKTIYYKGLPVTFSSLIIPIYYIISNFFHINKYSYLIIYIIIGFMFILNIKIKKPNGIWYFVFSILAILSSIIIVWGL